MRTMKNGDAATHALAEALGSVVKVAVESAVEPLAVKIDQLVPATKPLIPARPAPSDQLLVPRFAVFSGGIGR